MTAAQRGGLATAIKRSHWNKQVGIAMFLRRNPQIIMQPEDYAFAVGVGRTVFPSIQGLKEGPFPVYKDRPFYDSRLLDTEEQRAWDEEAALL